MRRQLDEPTSIAPSISMLLLSILGLSLGGTLLLIVGFVLFTLIRFYICKQCRASGRERARDGWKGKPHLILPLFSLSSLSLCCTILAANTGHPFHDDITHASLSLVPLSGHNYIPASMKGLPHEKAPTIFVGFLSSFPLIGRALPLYLHAFRPSLCRCLPWNAVVLMSFS